MKVNKILVLALLGSVGLLVMGNGDDSSQNRRYTFYISPARNSELEISYLLDTKTGRLWFQTMQSKDNSSLAPLPYKAIDGKTYLTPPDDVNEVSMRPVSKQDSITPEMKAAMDKQMGLR